MCISDWSSDVCSSDLLRAVSVPGVSTSNVADRRHRDAGHQTASDDLVPRDLPDQPGQDRTVGARTQAPPRGRSEEHTSELQSLMRNSYAVFCLKKNNQTNKINTNQNINSKSENIRRIHTSDD